jgi:DNA-binding transcriptional LysR family regulator
MQSAQTDRIAIDEQLLSGFDLNLLVTFLVLCRERSVSRTARLMGVGQPAVSGSLCKLRKRFNDPLFTRSGRGVTPTPQAEQLAAILGPSMRRIEAVLLLNQPIEPLGLKFRPDIQH